MPVKVGLKYIEGWKESMEDEVLAYEQEPVVKGQIVCYGPSNFTRWSKKWGNTPIAEMLPGKSGKPCVINRGFGSSCAEHQLYYYHRMIRPLEPKVLVYACAGNGASWGYTDEELWELGQRVIAYARTDFPDIRIYLCGPKASIRTDEKAYQKISEFSNWMKEFAEATPNCFFIDILNHPYMAGRKDIFIEDGVHFNKEGYELYAKIFREALAEELDKY